MNEFIEVNYFVERVRDLAEYLESFNTKVYRFITYDKEEFNGIDLPKFLIEAGFEANAPIHSHLANYLEYLISDEKDIKDQIAFCNNAVNFFLPKEKHDGFWTDVLWDEALTYFTNIDILKQILATETGKVEPTLPNQAYKILELKKGAGRPKEAFYEESLLTREQSVQFFYLLSEMKIISKMNKKRVAETFEALTGWKAENNNKFLKNPTGLLDEPKKARINELLGQIIKVIQKSI